MQTDEANEVHENEGVKPEDFREEHHRVIQVPYKLFILGLEGEVPYKGVYVVFIDLHDEKEDFVLVERERVIMAGYQVHFSEIIFLFMQVKVPVKVIEIDNEKLEGDSEEHHNVIQIFFKRFTLD